MDIVKAFQNNDVGVNITIQGTHIEPLFRASDIGLVLGFSDINNTVKTFNQTEKVRRSTPTLGGEQEVNFLTEKGLYKLLFKSRKEVAIQFQDWVCEVIKEIRLNGIYDLQKQLKDKDTQRTINIKNNFEGKRIVYIGYADRANKILKWGKTYRTSGRLEEHKNTYDENFTYEYVYESLYYEEIERRLKNHPEIRKRIIEKEYAGQNRVELMQLETAFDITQVNDIILKIKTEVEFGEVNKDKDAEINKLKLELIEKDKIIQKIPDHIDQTHKYIHIISHKDLLDHYSFVSSKEPEEGHKFSYRSENTPEIIRIAKILTNPHKSIEYQDIKQTLDFCILMYDEYKIHTNPEQLCYFINRYKSNRLVNTNKARVVIEEKVYKEFIEKALIQGPTEKSSCGMLCEEFFRWYTEHFPDSDKSMMKTQQGNWAISFREEFMKTLTELLKLDYKHINIIDKEKGLNLSKVSGFIGLGIKRIETTSHYDRTLYESYTKEFLTVTNNPCHKVSRKELLDDFTKWTEINGTFNSNSKNKTYTTTFIKELLGSIESITKIPFNNNKTKILDSGIFEGLTHKNFNCVMNITKDSEIDRLATRREKRVLSKNEKLDENLKRCSKCGIVRSLENFEICIKTSKHYKTCSVCRKTPINCS